MESSPTNIDATSEVSDKKEIKKKDKKSAIAGRLVGAFAVQPETKSESKSEKKFETEESSEAEKKQAEKDTSHENEEPANELTSDEQHFIERELVRAAEDAEPTPFEEIPEDDPERPVRQFRRRVVEGEDVEKAATEILEELAIEPETEIDASSMDEAPELRDHAVPSEETTDENETVGESIFTKDKGESDDSEETPQAANTGGGGSSTPPPVPPTGLPGSGGADGGHGRGFRPAEPVAILIPQMHRPNTMPVAATAEYYDQGNPATAALVGGIIGYLIGRRRGRIKTEKKLFPVQKKLQKEVVNLQWQLKAKETKIRAAAREHSRVVHERPTQPKAEKQLMLTPTHVVIERAASGQKKERQAAPEAAAFHGKKQARERIGHVIVNAETAPRTTHQAVERQLLKPEGYTAPDPLTLEKTYYMMSRAELLRISEKIIIDGTSLRQVYENRLIGEHGLRRLVVEHFRKGGDIKRQLRREIVEREIDFERDPIMRDHASTQSSKGESTTTPNKANLQTLLAQANSALPANPDEAAYYKARADFEAKEHRRQKKQQRVWDAVMTLIIIILVTVILALLLNRH